MAFVFALYALSTNPGFLDENKNTKTRFFSFLLKSNFYAIKYNGTNMCHGICSFFLFYFYQILLMYTSSYAKMHAKNKKRLQAHN